MDDYDKLKIMQTWYKQNNPYHGELTDTIVLSIIDFTYKEAYEAGRQSVLDRMPSEEDSRNERLRWAKGMYVFAPIKNDYMEQQIQTLGINPWNSCYEWLKEKLTDEG
jgi:hypothetical protein